VFDSPIRRLILSFLIVAVLGTAAFVTIMVRRPAAPPEAPRSRPRPQIEPAPPVGPPAPAPAAAPERAGRAPVARGGGAPVRREEETRPEPAAEAPAVGLLNIESDVPDAQVFLNRQFIGATPIRAHEVPPGTYRVNISAPGFEGIAETIDVRPGPRDLVFRLREVRLDAAIDVIHKHRMGSCKGRLIATPAGLWYETDDKGDLFNSTLVDLETFEVDYLKKNLRVKVRKGRTFDFTDPAGNADRLFVFHRDVDKARDRLRKGDPPAGLPVNDGSARH
jgi:hypothetical protein